MANKEAPKGPLAPLPFGVPQLDQLLGYEGLSAWDVEVALTNTTSLTLVGQDGTGKSIFALHLASAYLAVWNRAATRLLTEEERREGKKKPEHADSCPPLVIYASSDLRHDAARSVWHNFCLDYPWHRYVPFANVEEIDYRRTRLDRLGDERPFRVGLERRAPFASPGGTDARADATVTAHVRGVSTDTSSARVAFVDLASQTTGDDWLFLARLVASVSGRSSARSMLIVDSVAGFETLIGDRNSFGERMTRRAKIAQLIRVAAPNWHTVFVVEEPENGTHHPEEYVTDAVIHLRRQGANDRTGRVLEIEKCRARSYGTGEHPFEIRSGFGSSTGNWENPDDPMALLHEEFISRKPAGDSRQYHSYIQVFPSLHYLSGQFARAVHTYGAGKKSDINVPFGVPYLDRLLAAPPALGLPAGSITSLIGDEGTLKSSLAEQFLVEGFRYLPAALEHVYGAVREWIGTDKTKNVLEFVRDHPFLYTAKDVPDFAGARINASPGQWFLPDEGHFSRQNKAVRDVSNSRWILRSRVQLERNVIGVDGKNEKVPLSTRRDVSWFYKTVTPDELSDYYRALGLATEERRHAYQAFILTLTLLRSSSGFLVPAVFLSTHDTTADALSTRVLDKLWPRLEAVLKPLLDGANAQLKDICRDAIALVLQRFLVVRRLELVDASSQQVWQITRECVTHALHLVGNLPRLVQAPPEQHAGEVRVVISDLRLLRDTYPTVAKDPLFLPTLVFRLRRLGVTALLVDSDRGRPDQDPTHAMNGALRSLVDHQLYTWKVPFFGEQRIAISVLPPIAPTQLSVIRELKMSDAKTIDVHPHFELYSGLERGDPQAVPLEVVFYAETPAFDRYVEEEKAVFGRLFSPIDPQQAIIQVRKTHDYHALRDYCHLPGDTKLPHTLVFMIDGYWGTTRKGSLRLLKSYLDEPLDGAQPESPTPEDVFALFRDTRADQLARRQEPTGKRRITKKEFFARTKYFDVQMDLADRIPFMWDFGFLLCNKAQWQNAEEIRLPVLQKQVGDIWKELVRIDVDANGLNLHEQSEPKVEWREFFEACTVVADAERTRTGRPIAAFDFFTGGVDSLIALFFEIWFSEIRRDRDRVRQAVGDARAALTSVSVDDELRTLCSETVAAAETWVAWIDKLLAALATLDKNSRRFLQEILLGESPEPLSQRYTSKNLCVPDAIEQRFEKTPQALSALRLCWQARLEGCSLQWYKAWLLLIEVLDLRQYFSPQEPFDFKPRDPAFEAVAARHWYRTACAMPSHAGEHRTLVPVRLPGVYSLRGTWCLAVASGSRSYRLADRALDILSSRRANRSRLHRGLGLPTRDVFEEAPNSKALERVRVLSGLSVSTADTVHRVAYADLLALGAGPDGAGPDGAGSDDGKAHAFRWLFRHRLREYDRQARIIRRWMNRIFAWSAQYRYDKRTNWKSGFTVYDEMAAGNLSSPLGFDSFKKWIPLFLDASVDDLNRASDADPVDSSSPSRVRSQ